MTGFSELVDIRVAKIISVEDFPEARKPSYKLRIDFGNYMGVKKSCAQLVSNYSKEDLKGRLVLCAVNVPPKKRRLRDIRGSGTWSARQKGRMCFGKT
jgi:tRNA-binding EMAP/Myf-like protein